jgi:phospholipid/cholesterol/gamma-HCH transport system ATP-binding protein
MKKEMAISIQDVWKSFGKNEILRGLSLDVPKGKIISVLGFSGTGKSVLLKHILGLLHPDKGEVFVKHLNVPDLKEKQLRQLRQSFGMLFQEVALFDSLNVFDNVAFPIREHERGISFEALEKRVSDLLSLVELEKDIFFKMPHELSGGMKKRVGLARAIALEPEILLCDEPTTGLDPVTTETINDLIVASQKKFKGTVFMISHDVHAALRISHIVAMLWEGKVVEVGTPEEFVQSRHKVVQNFLHAAGVRV